MISKNISIIGATLALLAWGLVLSPTFAADPQPRMNLTHAESVPLGGRIELAASVIGPDDVPLEGVAVEFTADVEFQNTFDTVVIGRARTDAAGVARTVYAPRTGGEISVGARTTETYTGEPLEASSTLTVLPGEHLFHPENLIYDLRGQWDWFVQWAWLVVLPATAFAIYLFTMVLLWTIRQDGAAQKSGPRTFASGISWLIPVAGVGLVLVAASILILGITLRPWAGLDTGWRTELNLSHEVPHDYTRSSPITLGEEPLLDSWRPGSDRPTSAVDAAMSQYVGRGCSSCHGLDLTGAAVGEDLTESSASDLRKAFKNGPEGMPAYTFLSDEEVRLLTVLITGKEASPRQPAAPIVRSTSTPLPTSAPVTIPTATLPPGQPEATAIAVVTPAPTPEPERQGPVSIEAAFATITVDGDTADWSGIPVSTVTLQQIKPIPGADMGELPPINVDLRMAIDADNVYLLLEVRDDYDFVIDDSGLSASVAIMIRIDDPAAPHMGTTEEDQKKSLGKVDIWHWELDCGPGQMSGGITGAAGGNDPQCNLDDEYAETPEELEDDDSPQAENTLAGVWEHTGRGDGAGSDGVWIFEISRPLQTNDPDDAQFEAGGNAFIALAYWDPDETVDGWTSEGHLQSSTGGWIEVTLP